MEFLSCPKILPLVARSLARNPEIAASDIPVSLSIAICLLIRFAKSAMSNPMARARYARSDLSSSSISSSMLARISSISSFVISIAIYFILITFLCLIAFFKSLIALIASCLFIPTIPANESFDVIVEFI